MSREAFTVLKGTSLSWADFNEISCFQTLWPSGTLNTHLPPSTALIDCFETGLSCVTLDALELNLQTSLVQNSPSAMGVLKLKMCFSQVISVRFERQMFSVGFLNDSKAMDLFFQLACANINKIKVTQKIFFSLYTFAMGYVQSVILGECLIYETISKRNVYALFISVMAAKMTIFKKTEIRLIRWLKGERLLLPNNPTLTG